MNTNDKTSRILGVAFLLQFITSVSSGLFLQPAWLVPGNIHETMLKIAANPSLMKTNILVDMLTALGVVFLGAMLFVTLRKQDEKIALVGLGFYILEGALLAASKIATFSLLRMSQEYASAGQPEYLQTLANLALESMDFVGFTLHMLAFSLGAILFYYLLYKSGLVPRVLSLWGLITILPLLIATLLAMFDYQVSQFVAFPYFPFEFVIGVWILVKGIPETRQEFTSPVMELTTN
ncbi:MAG: DUF4386 domain-containing protein [Anaerolineales bacterium]|jgi:hypothetical protein